MCQKMDGEQLKYLLVKKYNIDCVFCAPEAVTYHFKRTRIFDDNDKYHIALVVLTDYSEAFKKRIDKVIVDEWLSRKTFVDILEECIQALSDLNDPKEHIYLQDWQVQLLNLFISFKQ